MKRFLRRNRGTQAYPIDFIGMTPEQRAKLLEETDLFATAHRAAAAGGQSTMPQNLNTDYHFVAFVRAPDALDTKKHRIIELDGRRSGPVDLGESNDLLAVSLSSPTLTSSDSMLRMLLVSFGKSTWTHSSQLASL